MDIEFLYFKSCPNHEKALELLKKVLSEAGVQAVVKTINVTNEKMARQLRFPGSPTIRINGKDIDETDHGSSLEYGLKCRIYQNGRKLSGLPPEDRIKQAVQEARSNA